MDNCALMMTWPNFKAVILAGFLAGANTEISHEIRGFLFSKNSGNMMYQKALHHFG